jgi:Lrp/AsnC family leucine-responsive transcriptional regulator
MIKKSEEQQQKDERKILYELQNNSQVTSETIAQRYGLSKQEVLRIVKKLEERHIIWGYTAIIDNEKINQKQFMVFIKRTNRSLGENIIDKIDSLQLEDLALPLGVSIESSYFVHGNYEWIICFIAQDINQAKKFCDTLNREFPGIIQEFCLQQVLYCVRDHFIFNPDRKKLRDLMG